MRRPQLSAIDCRIHFEDSVIINAASAGIFQRPNRNSRAGDVSFAADNAWRLDNARCRLTKALVRRNGSFATFSHSSIIPVRGNERQERSRGNERLPAAI